MKPNNHSDSGHGFGIWVNNLRMFLGQDSPEGIFVVDTQEEAKQSLEEYGYIDSTRADIQMSAYVARVPPELIS